MAQKRETNYNSKINTDTLEIPFNTHFLEIPCISNAALGNCVFICSKTNDKQNANADKMVL